MNNTFVVVLGLEFEIRLLFLLLEETAEHIDLYICAYIALNMCTYLAKSCNSKF